MTTYSVYLPPIGSPDPAAETFRLIPDKKSPWALIFPILWLLYHRLWLVLLAYLVITAALFLLFSWKQHAAVMYLSALPGLYLLLEGQELVRGKFEREGWRFAGIVEGENKQEAEIRFLADENAIVAEHVSTPAHAKAAFRKTPNHNQGLFPE